MSNLTPQSPVDPLPTDNSLSPLAKSLKQLGLPNSIASQLESEGFYDLIDLGSNAGQVSSLLKTINGLNPNTRTAIVRLWRGRYEELNKNVPPELPKLSPGTKIDLSAPVVTIDGTDYDLPLALQHTLSSTASSVSPDAEIVSALDLTTEQWLAIAKRLNLCHAINLDKIFNPDEDSVANQSAFVWNVPDPTIGWADADQANQIETQTSYTAATSSKVHSRIVDVDLSLQTPFVAAVAKAKRDEKDSQSALAKTLYMTGKWLVPRVKLKMLNCLSLSPKFIESIESALNENQTNQEKFKALRDVFNDFGHAVPKHITLGGMMFLTYTKEVKGNVNEKEVNNIVRVGVLAKKNMVQGGANATFTDGEGQKTSADEIVENTDWKCVGGDETINANPSQWAPTVKPPANWKVIKREGLLPVTTFMEESLRNEVLSVWNKGLEELWGTKPPMDYTFPDFNGEPFKICKGKTSKDVIARVDCSIDFGDMYIPCGRYDYLSSRGDLDIHIWTLIYSGKTDGMENQGSPLYWITAYNPKLKTKSDILDFYGLHGGSSSQNIYESNHAKFLYSGNVNRSEPRGTNAAISGNVVSFINRETLVHSIRDEDYFDMLNCSLWSIHPKINSQSDAYVIRNYGTGYFMSCQYTLNKDEKYVDLQPIELTQQEDNAIIYCLVKAP